jgi:hypothetical protein
MISNHVRIKLTMKGEKAAAAPKAVARATSFSIVDRRG